MKKNVKRMMAMTLVLLMVLSDVAMAQTIYSMPFSLKSKGIRTRSQETAVAEVTRGDEGIGETGPESVLPEGVEEAPKAEEETKIEADPAEQPDAAKKPAEQPSEEPAEESVEEASKEPAEELTEEQNAEDVRTLGDADVRLEGDGMSEIFITLPDDTPLVVLGAEGDWVKVEIDGQIGYIYKDSVQGIEFEQDELPEDERLQPKLTIFSSRRSTMVPDETVYLTSKLENWEGYEFAFQWYCDKGDGHYEEVPGATEDNLSFVASIETLAYNWKLQMRYREIEGWQTTGNEKEQPLN